MGLCYVGVCWERADLSEKKQKMAVCGTQCMGRSQSEVIYYQLVFTSGAAERVGE